MADSTDGGTTTSLNNTVQAKDDYFYADEDQLLYFDVMLNDLGGTAKVLWSVDNSSDDGSGDLVSKDLAGVIEYSELGSKITLTSDGRIAYDSSTSSTITSLPAGAIAYDQFTYAIRLSNGTLSWATVTVQVTGVNDAATISGDNTGEVTEDVTLTTSGTLIVTDPDTGENELQPIAAGTAGDNGYGTFEVNANGQWTYTLDNSDPAVQALPAGATLTDTITVTSEDGTDTEVITVTITGTNGPATISGDNDGDVTEDGTLTASGTLIVTDEDTGENELQPIAAGTAGDNGYGTFEVNANGQWTYTLNNSNPDVQNLAAGAMLTDTITVTSEDGTDTQVITVTITGTADGVTPPTTYTGLDAVNDHDDDVGSDSSNSPLISGTNDGETIDGRTGTGQTADTINALGGDDTVNAGDGGDKVYGGSGNDTIYGGTGNDLIYGQSGDDHLYGQDNNDQLYGGSGNDYLDGGNFTDTLLNGGSGNDTILGGVGTDTIIGGYGADLLTGGTGDDVFAFFSKLDTNDTITDFRAAGMGLDQLDLSGIDANELLANDQDFAWGGDEGPIANGLWFTYDAGSNTTTLYGDTDGNLATAEFMVTLQNFSGFNAYADPLSPPPDTMVAGVNG